MLSLKFDEGGEGFCPGGEYLGEIDICGGRRAFLELALGRVCERGSIKVRQSEMQAKVYFSPPLEQLLGHIYDC